MKEHISWPIIGKYEKNEHLGNILHYSNGFDVIDCECCGFKHIVPIPTFEELENIYKHEYYSSDKPLYLKRHEEDLDWWNLEYETRLDNLLDLVSNGLPKRILDVGSGPGYFLKKAKEKGWEETGIEPSQQAGEYSINMGLNIINHFLSDELAAGLGKFSAIHLSEVLEHINEPHVFLKTIFNLMESGGAICISIPNDYNPIQYALTQFEGFSPWWVVAPHHINYFYHKSLSDLLNKVGFITVKKDSTFPIDMFLLMGENYVGHDEKGRLVHSKRKQLEASLNKAGLESVRRKLMTAFAEVGIGRTAIVYAIKK
jgi:SAM-dependent methyltransferase